MRDADDKSRQENYVSKLAKLNQYVLTLIFKSLGVHTYKKTMRQCSLFVYLLVYFLTFITISLNSQINMN